VLRLKPTLLLLSLLTAGNITLSGQARSDDFLAGLVAHEKNIHYRVELQVGSERVSIDRTVHCHPYFFGELNSPFDVYYRPDRSALSKRLPDGSGVIVILPNYCYYASKIPPGEIPPVAFVDDASDPHRMDIYVSRARLTSSGSAVQMRTFEATITPARGISGLDDEFAAWEVRDNTAPMVDGAISFRGVIGYGIGFDPSEAPVVAAAAGSSPSEPLIPGRAPWGFWLDRHRGFDLVALLQGSFYDPSSVPAKIAEQDSGDSLVPFVLDMAGRFSPDVANRGVLTLYRDIGEQEIWGASKIMMGTKTVDLDTTSNPALYLPDEKIIVVASPFSMAWAPRPEKRP
jgi:hypothetical protein